MRWRFIIAGVVIIALGVFGWLWNAMQPVEQPEARFVIAEGASRDQIIEQLKADGRIRSIWLAKWYVRSKAWSTVVQEGTYQLSGAYTYAQLLDALHEGRGKDTSIRITFPEGWRVSQFADRLQARGIVDAQEFVDALEKRRAEVTELLPGLKATAALEGVLFPDTYALKPGSSADSVIDIMLANYKRRVEPLIAASSTTLSPREVVTLASILERELNTSEDRAMAADLFIRRLKIGMRLQSDATVNYVTGKSALRPTGTDLATLSPYNTYQNEGLPPGPINNPGLDTIRAVLNPIANEYFFYLSTPDKKTIWAKSYQDHLSNIRDYLD